MNQLKQWVSGAAMFALAPMAVAILFVCMVLDGPEDEEDKYLCSSELFA
jgi:hypothetical protein